MHMFIQTGFNLEGETPTTIHTHRANVLQYAIAVIYITGGKKT